jgi:glutamate formiminotransferase/formiminotetrahydrofolate cyclodeaminase
MQLSLESISIIKAMAEIGNPNSVSDAGVAALCARSAVIGAHLNVKINAAGITDKASIQHILTDAERIEKDAIQLENEIIKQVNNVINKNE